MVGQKLCDSWMGKYLMAGQALRTEFGLQPHLDQGVAVLKIGFKMVDVSYTLSNNIKICCWAQW